MECKSEERISKLLGAQTHVWNHIFSFINSMSLKCAIDLDIPDIIHKHGEPMPLSKLTASVSLHPSKANCIYRLMRILTHSGFFSEVKVNENDLEVGYVLTDACTLLLKDNPLSMTPFLHAMLDPILTKPWHELATWFRNDDPSPFHTAHGMKIWDYAGRDPKLNHLFNDAMASDAELVGNVVIERCGGVFKGLESVVDVGGGTEADNLKFVGGDMFESVPPADAVLLKWILHDWNDEQCVRILKKCKEGVKRKVIAIDMVLESEKLDYESTKTQLMIDMVVMVLYPGKERTEKEWAKIIFSAGFTDYKITPLVGLRSLIEIYP
ncbi:hypothetical protein LR48_Vigan08g100100 [Vigna angularis]|uniref:O-methyltransferase domain-containing protein n=2 Tax=Phaseolus angularis TaxID=3914 RepID=A0A0L9V662_PHAAN|nr:hypothetical protein LR48_Vigan08g100100 [Vigna angularis]